MYYNAATLLIQPPGVTSVADIAEFKSEKARRNKIVNYVVLLSLFAANIISFVCLIIGKELPTRVSDKS
jgi:hypothetical protein